MNTSTKSPLAKHLLPYSFFGVGSLPFTDPGKACDFVLSLPQMVPFWPELPQRAQSEFMLERSNRALSSSWEGYTKEEAAGLFSLRKVLRQPLPVLKCQVTGPLTHARYGEILSHDFHQALEKALLSCRRQISWQYEFCSELAESLVMVLDEPALMAWPGLSLAERTEIYELYSYLKVFCGECGFFLGIHTCGSFSYDFLSFPMDLFSFAYHEETIESGKMQDAQAHWRAAIRRGAVFAPGVYPAVGQGDLVEFVDKGRADLHRFSSFLNEICQDPSPAVLQSADCGHAGSSLEWLEALYSPKESSTAETRERLE